MFRGLWKKSSHQSSVVMAAAAAASGLTLVRIILCSNVWYEFERKHPGLLLYYCTHTHG
jgi:hypothetical protein